MLRIHLMSFLALLLRKLSLIQREEKSPHLLKNVGKFCIRIKFLITECLICDFDFVWVAVGKRLHLFYAQGAIGGDEFAYTCSAVVVFQIRRHIATVIHQIQLSVHFGHAVVSRTYFRIVRAKQWIEAVRNK